MIKSKIYTDLSGGINLALTPLQLGLTNSKTFWADSENVEIFTNRGICRQNGNILIKALPTGAKIIGLHSVNFASDSDSAFAGHRLILIATATGMLYYYNTSSSGLVSVKEDFTSNAERVNFIDYLGGVVVANGIDEPVFFDKDGEIQTMNAINNSEQAILGQAMAVYKSRLWIGYKDTLYYSALGTYNDWSTADDAGFISNFHCDYNNITALKIYKDYLAVYKSDRVYLLSGTAQDDFSVTPFADKGVAGANCVVNADNRQFFFSDYVFSLEQTGVLSQISLSSEISQEIKPTFKNFNRVNAYKNFVLACESKNQIRFFVAKNGTNYLNTIWIYDYYNKAWFKRVLPQNITAACEHDTKILVGTSDGKILLEDTGDTFNNEAINFYWKSPFFALTKPNQRKSADEFYFLLADEANNNFDFCVYKDYDTLYSSDAESIKIENAQNMLWAYPNDDETPSEIDANTTYWSDENTHKQIWALSAEVSSKAEISESSYSFQLCVKGNKLAQNCCIVGLEFREIVEE